MTGTERRTLQRSDMVETCKGGWRWRVPLLALLALCCAEPVGAAARDAEVERLQLPAWTPNQPITGIRLAWDAPGVSGRQELRQQLILPVLPAAELRELDVDLDVAEQLALLQASRDRRCVIEALDRCPLGPARLHSELDKLGAQRLKRQSINKTT